MNALLRTLTVMTGLLVGISAVSAASYYDPVSDTFVFGASKQVTPTGAIDRSSLPDNFGSDELWRELGQGG